MAKKRRWMSSNIVRTRRELYTLPSRIPRWSAETATGTTATTTAGGGTAMAAGILTGDSHRGEYRNDEAAESVRRFCVASPASAPERRSWAASTPARSAGLHGWAGPAASGPRPRLSPLALGGLQELQSSLPLEDSHASLRVLLPWLQAGILKSP